MASEQRCRCCATPLQPQDRFCEECGVPIADQRRDRVEVDVGVAAGVSDRGKRRHRNEDDLALRGLTAQRDGITAAVAIVCDGVASRARSDEASEAAVRAAAEATVAALRADPDPVIATHAALRAADEAVTELSEEPADWQAPACTFVSAVVAGGTATVGWVGDSRAYWIPGPGTETMPPVRLTEDDSWLAQVVSAGELTAGEATADPRAHAITAWLGGAAQRDMPHVVMIEPGGPGVVVVCTDGLWNYLDGADELAAALPAQAFDAPLDAVRKLVDIALHCGGHDNITVAVLPLNTQPGGA